MLDRLNQLILDERVPGTFLTLVHGEIEHGAIEHGEIVAGAPCPALAGLRRAAAAADVAGRGAARECRCPPAGAGRDRGAGLHRAAVTLGPGDLLLCVTDGVTRRRDGDRLLDDDDGLARLLAACAGLTADVVADKVHEEVRTFGGDPAVDGMAVLAIRAVS